MSLFFVNSVMPKCYLSVPFVNFELLDSLMTFDSILCRWILFELFLNLNFFLGIKLNFRERYICSLTFDRLFTETFCNSWLGEVGFLGRCGVSCDVGSIISSNWGLIVWLFRRFRDFVASSGDVGGILLANWGLFEKLFRSVAICSELSNDDGCDRWASKGVRMLSSNFGSDVVFSSDFSNESYGDLSDECIFFDRLNWDTVICGLN